MSDEKSVPVFLDIDGERVQVGKASADTDGVRSIRLFKKYEGVSKKDLTYGDEELPAAPISVVPDAAQAAEPVENAPVDPEAETDWVDATPEIPVEEIDEDDVDDVEELPEEFEPASAVPNDDEDDK